MKYFCKICQSELKPELDNCIDYDEWYHCVKCPRIEYFYQYSIFPHELYIRIEKYTILKNEKIFNICHNYDISLTYIKFIYDYIKPYNTWHDYGEPLFKFNKLLSNLSCEEIYQKYLTYQLFK